MLSPDLRLFCHSNLCCWRSALVVLVQELQVLCIWRLELDPTTIKPVQGFNKSRWISVELRCLSRHHWLCQTHSHLIRLRQADHYLESLHAKSHELSSRVEISEAQENCKRAAPSSQNIVGSLRPGFEAQRSCAWWACQWSTVCYLDFDCCIREPLRRAWRALQPRHQLISMSVDKVVKALLKLPLLPIKLDTQHGQVWDILNYQCIQTFTDKTEYKPEVGKVPFSAFCIFFCESDTACRSLKMACLAFRTDWHVWLLTKKARTSVFGHRAHARVKVCGATGQP